MTQTHELKCWSSSFVPMVGGLKNFELRKNDRDFKVGDVLFLREWNPDTDYTGNTLYVRVMWILYEGFGLPEGYCIMSTVQMPRYFGMTEPWEKEKEHKEVSLIADFEMEYGMVDNWTEETTVRFNKKWDEIQEKYRG